MSFADALESYLIAEEGFLDRFKRRKEPGQPKDPGVVIDPKMKAIFTKIGFQYRLPNIHYIDIGEIIEGSDNPERLTSKDMKYIHSKMYTFEDAEANFLEWHSDDTKMREFIEKNEPLPVWANGMGDYWCYLKNGKIDEFIHDAYPHFDNKFGTKLPSIEKAVEKYREIMKGVNP